MGVMVVEVVEAAAAVTVVGAGLYAGVGAGRHPKQVFASL